MNGNIKVLPKVRIILIEYWWVDFEVRIDPKLKIQIPRKFHLSFGKHTE